MAIVKYLGHPQHLIVANSCVFRLATEVTGANGHFVVSTVGEYEEPGDREGFTEIGYRRLYETFVFTASDERKDCGCPELASYSEIDSLAANSPAEATSNHETMVEKYSSIVEGAKP